MSFATLMLAAPALAAQTVPIDIPAEPLAQAVVDLARQTGSNIGGVDPARCAAPSRAIRGAMTARAALDRLLRGSHCRFDQPDADTFVLKLRLPPLLRLPAPHHEEIPADAPTEVMVTANRRLQNAATAASAISVINADTLARRGGDLSDVAAQAAGLTLTNLGAGRNKILLRGLSDGVFTGRTQSSVGLYLDEAPITYNAPDPDLLLVDMARIEVLKGPQGALYGEGSISGVVRLVTRAPDLSRFGGSLNAGVGLSDQAAASSRWDGVLNLPVIKDRLGVRVVAYSDEAGGYIRDVSSGQTHINSVQRFGSRVSALWRVNADWSVSASQATQHINAKDSQYVSGNLGAYARDLIVREPHDNDFNQASFGVQGRTGLGTLKLSLNHLHHHLDSRYDASPLAGQYGLPATAGLIYDQAQAVELTTRELTLASPSDQRLRWLAGVFSAQSTERLTPRLAEPTTRRPLYSEQRHDRITTLAAFGELSYDLTPHWTAVLGLRQTDTRHDLDSHIETETVGGDHDEQIRDRASTVRLSHQMTLRYRPNDTATYYIQSGEGYRGGGFNTTHLYGTQAVPVRYAGDELNSYEAGAKLRFPAANLRLDLAVFKAYWRDLQSDQLQTDGLPVTVNIGNGVNTGLEVEATWRPGPALTLKAAGLINEPRLTRPNPDFVTSEDSGLPYIARQGFSLSADWQRNLGNAVWRSGADLTWRGRSHLNFGPLQDIEMGGYAELALDTQLEFGPMRYGLRLENALGADGNSFAYGNPFSLGLTPQQTPPRPRTLWISLSRDF
ncbi:TonB-dependent receptor [Asticcacaulis taihuensis]|uniref:TonB-dependent receptor n=1 Tax=Asticcacaulis taihuensis TaxID=260084 RepID=UPI003F7BBE3C